MFYCSMRARAEKEADEYIAQHQDAVDYRWIIILLIEYRMLLEMEKFDPGI
jgi:hypothetical protein